MTYTIYQIDAFAKKTFEGNPAAVVPLDKWLTVNQMQQIAMENNLAETAFFVPQGDDFHLRWFTPAIEVNLCGHATLASAHVLFQQLNYNKEEIVFHTRSGALKVRKAADAYLMDFPADFAKETTVTIDEVATMLGAKPIAVYQGKDDYLAIFNTQKEVAALKPDFRKVATLASRGLIATAPGDDHDFVSRCFFPQAGIDEDPVTGSAHTLMTPYWAKQIGKSSLSAKQISPRSGELQCQLKDDRVLIVGNAVTYLIGEIFL